jgi:hypothetical protein
MTCRRIAAVCHHNMYEPYQSKAINALTRYFAFHAGDAFPCMLGCYFHFVQPTSVGHRANVPRTTH